MESCYFIKGGIHTELKLPVPGSHGNTEIKLTDWQKFSRVMSTKHGLNVYLLRLWPSSRSSDKQARTAYQSSLIQVTGVSFLTCSSRWSFLLSRLGFFKMNSFKTLHTTMHYSLLCTQSHLSVYTDIKHTLSPLNSSGLLQYAQTIYITLNALCSVML